MKNKLQKRLRRHRRSAEEEGRGELRNDGRDDGGKPIGVGTQIAALFRGKGLTREIPEQRGQPARFAKFD